MVSRESGKKYFGELKGFGGVGSMNVNVDSVFCSREYSGVTDQSRGIMTIKSLLDCSDGTTLRCELERANGKGFGTCTDVNNVVFDIIAKF